MHHQKPRIWPALVVGAIQLPLIVLMGLVLQLPVLALESTFGPTRLGEWLASEAPGAYITFGLLGELLFVLMLFWLARRSRQDPWERFAVRPARLSLWMQPVILLGAFTASFIGSRLASFLLEAPSDLASHRQSILSTGFEELFLVFLLAMAVLPSITEELLFRGYIQSRLLQRLPAWIAIGITSVLFAAVHGELNYAIAVLPIGIWLGYVAFVADSVWPGLLCHFLFNALVTLIWGLHGDEIAESNAATETGEAAEDLLMNPAALLDLVPPVLFLLALGWILRRRARGSKLNLSSLSIGPGGAKPEGPFPPQTPDAG